jgi:WD40 repeat protein
VLRGHQDWLWSAAWSPDRARVVTASGDRTVRMWRADGSGASIVLCGHQVPIKSAVFSPDGARIASASDDGTARIWNADGSGEPYVLGNHGRRIGEQNACERRVRAAGPP